jgi:GNAT superfamily N-acetyltransferase
MNIRPIDIQKDRQKLLEFHCVTNYESSDPALRKAYTSEQYREIWIRSHGPEEFLSALAKSMKDSRTIVEFWENGGSIIAYVWVTFTDWPEYNATGAEISDILVVPEFQRRGIATQVIKHVEELACKRGATLLRSGTGSENVASQELHAKLGFQTYRVEFEKEL